MKKELKSKDFIPSPEYPGGTKAMTTFINSNIIYPESAKEQNIEGTSVVKAEINFKGEVVSTKIMSSLHKDCDAEAERVVQLLKFKVSKVRNLKISFFKTFHIHFKKPAETKPTQAMAVKYNLVSSGSMKKEKEQLTISYTIKMDPKTE